MKRLGKLGPGLVVTAAFIGPGTVTTASKAGAEFGFALLWAVVFSIIATLVLQEMAARLGLVGRVGLGQAIRQTFDHPVARPLVCGLVVLAIGFGNAAYQTGNITGAAIGAESLTGISMRIWAVLIGLVALGLLWAGKYKIIEFVLIGLVAVMSLVFLVTAVMVQPDPAAAAQGMFVPAIPAASITTVIALIGTTVVPYNLFLHASSVQEKWTASEPVDHALSESRWDTSLSIVLGGIITIAIVATAAGAFYGKEQIKNAADMARQLEPLLGGQAARLFFATGLVAAGLTSAITAPLAAAFATVNALGWKQDLHSWRFRGVWLVVLLAGTSLAATLEKSPTETIVIAQVANGLLLPVVAIFLLVAVNRTELMGKYKNGTISNLLSGVVVLIAAGLGIYKILTQFGL